MNPVSQGSQDTQDATSPETLEVCVRSRAVHDTMIQNLHFSGPRMFRSPHLLQRKGGGRGTSRPSTTGLYHGHILGNFGLDSSVPQLPEQLLIVPREEESHELIFVDLVRSVLVDAVKNLLCPVLLVANGLARASVKMSSGNLHTLAAYVHTRAQTSISAHTSGIPLHEPRLCMLTLAYTCINIAVRGKAPAEARCCCTCSAGVSSSLVINPSPLLSIESKRRDASSSLFTSCTAPGPGDEAGLLLLLLPPEG